MDEFLTIHSPSQGIYKEKGSKFLAFAFPVKNEDEVKLHLSDVKGEHHKCNHHCYAFRIKPDGSFYRSSDDREPAGSAGRPILNQLLSYNVTDALIVVARYFGGTLLGVPGLINAYRSAAEDALKNATIIKVLVHEHFEISFPSEYLNDIIVLLRKEGAIITGQEYGELVVIKFSIIKSKALNMVSLLTGDRFRSLLIK